MSAESPSPVATANVQRVFLEILRDKYPAYVWSAPHKLAPISERDDKAA